MSLSPDQDEEDKTFLEGNNHWRITAIILSLHPLKLLIFGHNI
jgi:hypothetical protein